MEKSTKILQIQMDPPLNLANHGFHLCACNLVHYYDLPDLFSDIWLFRVPSSNRRSILAIEQSIKY